jgi:hypothetical protein
MELWYYDNDNDESHSNFFLSGSLHFRLKFYCSDEDQSSKLCCFRLQDDARCHGDAPLLEKITTAEQPSFCIL